jgi:predicted GNAT family acetyltransferase
MALRNNTEEHRYELAVEGGTALLYYRLAPGVITLMHTEVPEALEGHGIGSKLVRAVLEDIRAQGLKVAVRCPFVSSWMGKHPEFNDLLQ